MNKEIITRKEAIELGLDRYYTGKPCKNGHMSERYTKTSACIECLKTNSLNWQKVNSFNGSNKHKQRLLQVIQRKCKKKDIPFDLTIEDIEFPTHCPVLGIELDLTGDNREASPSIDRIIPELGYVKDNIVIVSFRANRLKNDASLNEMRSLVSFYSQLIGT